MASAVEVYAARFLRSENSRARGPDVASVLDPLEEVYLALTLGVRDYVRKNGFTRVVIGLSGGVDSALTAVLAVDALGAENVWGLFMPSPYTSQDSYDDVAELGTETGDLRPDDSHHDAVRPLSAGACGDVRGACSPIRRKRISKPASGAISSWPSPTSSAIWCSPPATRAR